MKRELLILCTLIVISLITGCKEEPVEPAVEISPATFSILDYNSEQQLSANIPVTWSLSDPKAGEIDLEGTYTTGDSSGRFLLIATSQEDSTNRDSISVRVSNRADILNDLLGGGYVIYLRHAIATVGNDQFDISPKWHLSCNSDTARQLSPEGILQAEQLGEAFKSLEIPLADTIYSSEFCRCIQTPELMDLGLPIVTEPAITFYVYDELLRHEATKAFMDAFDPGDKNVLLSSHSFAPGGDYPAVSQGYAAIFQPQSGPTFITIIRDDELILLK
jgi:phosphohistidine phosphatase SixA